MKKQIFLSPPHMSDKEKELLGNAFESNWIAPIGPSIDQFEKELSHYIGVKASCVLSSGTAALHLALKILGVGKGDIVLCPSLTFAASANVILYEDAVPIFIDVDPVNWVIDINLLEFAMKKYSPKALIAVDLYGNPCNYNEINRLCKKYDVLLIEDAAESLGSSYNDNKCGSFGKIAALSFNGNKIITTSGGGALVSSNEDYIKKARFLSTQAREPFLHYEHKELGYNYRMSNLLAAVGIGQLSRIDYFIKKRRENFNYYFESFSSIDSINFMEESLSSNSNRWLTTLIINEEMTNVKRDNIINSLIKENIECRPVWKPMHMQPLYIKSTYVHGKKDISKNLFENGLCLPSGSNLNREDQNRIVEIILDCLNE
ncbi:MAG: pyridoxal phosphate-dependent aminotransferase [Candidatus Marinimicrobia bacterium]|nr:pyridoxal phosphate-dependent aminotransferase [Candidatus Neomarinimicrobiota bacterium]|tara:strand:+ start:3567 stop:4688 length:1122 start_codon:yes stop_codon:yes gene_type:complete